jgi:CheY-like chemotaxis protein
MTDCILIIDDNPINLRLASEILEMEGYGVIRATDAEDALRVLGTTSPRLILMDIALPGMDGLTLTRLLKADEAWKHTAIVALSAFAMKGDAQKALDAGCDGYVTKPIDTRTFAAQVREMIAASRP